MNLYILVVIISSILALLGNLNVNKYISLILIILTAIILSILPGFRSDNVGTDTQMYRGFLEIPTSMIDSSLGDIEKGYTLLIKYSGYLGLNDYFFLLISFLCNFLITYSIYKISNNKFISILSYLLFSSIYLSGFNILRQYIAISFCVFSLVYLFKKNYKIHFLLLFLAINFHYSAIFFLIFSFSYIMMEKKINYISIFLLNLLFPFFYTYFISAINLYFSNIFTSKADIYMNSSGEMGGGKILILDFILLTVLLFYNKYRNDEIYKFFCLMLVSWFSFNICIIFLGLNYEGPGRIMVYTFISFLFLFSRFQLLFKGDFYVLIQLLIIFLFFVNFGYSVFYMNIHQVFPYSFWW